jgi:hypothetical protein
VWPTPEKPWTLLARTYEAGKAVWGRDRFFGRERELQKILAALAGGMDQPFLLRGPRRMGKSSILRQLDWLLKNQAELRNVYSLDESHLDELSVVRPVLIDLQSLAEAGSAAKIEFFSTLLKRVCDALDRDAMPWPATAANPVDALANCLKILLAGKRSSLLIMVDEWDEVYRKGLEKLDSNLRSLMQEVQQVNWIISSTWITRHESGDGASPLHNMCDIMEIKEADWVPARAIVTEPAHRIGVRWHGHAVVAAVDQMGQLPFLIQMLCAAVIDRLNSERRNVVQIDTVRAVVAEMAQGKLPIAEAYFKSIFHNYARGQDNSDAVRAMGWVILWVLNKQQTLSKEEIKRRVLEQISSKLKWSPMFEAEFEDQFTLLDTVQSVIVKQEEQRYHFRVPVFRAWFDCKAKEDYPQMIKRLRHDLQVSGEMNL